jgi:hypothetical protein
MRTDNATCCGSVALGDPFDREYVHQGAMVTTWAAIAGGLVTLLLVPRVAFVVLRLQSSAMRTALHTRIARNKETLAVLESGGSSNHDGVNYSVASAPRLNSPADSGYLLQDKGADTVARLTEAIDVDVSRLRYVKVIANSPNRLMLACILMHACTALAMVISAMITLFARPYACCASSATHPSTSAQCDTKAKIYAVAPLPCLWSATAVNYFYVAANTCMAVFLGHIFFGTQVRMAVGLMLIHGMALTTTSLNFGLLVAHPHDRQMFTRTLAWCWIPDPPEARNHGLSPLVVVLLQLGSANIAIPVLTTLLCGAWWRLRRSFTIQAATRGYSLRAINLRLMPPVLFLVFETVADIICRAPSRDDGGYVWPVALGFTSFLFPLTGAVAAAVWALGEGVLPLLLPSTRPVEDFRLPSADFEPFSSLVLSLWKNEKFWRSDRQHLLERVCATGEDGHSAPFRGHHVDLAAAVNPPHIPNGAATSSSSEYAPDNDSD